jgi:hypothetical protein
VKSTKTFKAMQTEAATKFHYISSKQGTHFVVMLSLQFGIALCALQLSARGFAPFYAQTKALYNPSPEAGSTFALAFTAAGFIDVESNFFFPVMAFDPMDFEGMLAPNNDGCETDFWASGGLCHPLDALATWRQNAEDWGLNLPLHRSHGRATSL